jgi:hypothetical protein
MLKASLSGEVEMTLLAHVILPGQAQHVIQRGNNKDIIFVTEDE